MAQFNPQQLPEKFTNQQRLDKATENNKADFMKQLKQKQAEVFDLKINPIVEQFNADLEAKLRKLKVDPEIFNINPDDQLSVMNLISKLKQILRSMRAIEKKQGH